MNSFTSLFELKVKPFSFSFFLDLLILCKRTEWNNIEIARKNQILLLVLACNYKRIACNPGIVESNIDLKRFRENREKSSDAISTKLASTYKNNHHNLIGKNHEKSEKFVPMPSPFQPLHLTRDDVVTSGVPNQHYSHESQQTGGDEFNQLSAATSSPPTLANNGEVIFAIHHSQNSQSSPQFTSAGSFDLRNCPSYRHVWYRKSPLFSWVHRTAGAGAISHARRRTKSLICAILTPHCYGSGSALPSSTACNFSDAPTNNDSSKRSNDDNSDSFILIHEISKR